MNKQLKNRIVGELITREKYKFINPALVSDIVRDSLIIISQDSDVYELKPGTEIQYDSSKEHIQF